MTGDRWDNSVRYGNAPATGGDGLPFLQPGEWTPCQDVPHLFAAAEDERVTIKERASDVRAAQGVCASCLKRAPCARYAIENSETWGVWGGLTLKQRTLARRRVRRRLKQQEILEAS